MKPRPFKAVCLIVLIAFTWNILGFSGLALALPYSFDHPKVRSPDNPLITFASKTRAFAKAFLSINAALQQGKDQTVQLDAAQVQLHDLLALHEPVIAHL